MTRRYALGHLAGWLIVIGVIALIGILEGLIGGPLR